MTKTKSDHHITKAKLLAKKGGGDKIWFFQFLKSTACTLGEESVKKLANRIMIEAQQNPKVYKMNDICEVLEILPSQLEELREKYPPIEAAYSFAMMSIGNKRERGGLMMELNPGLIASSMAIYDKKWKELAEWKADLAKRLEAEKYTTFKIELAPIPSSELVPIKENNDY